MTHSNPYGSTASLRIAMLSLHSSPIGPLGTSDTGGMSVYVRELSRWLGAAGHKIDIFTCAGGAAPETRLYPNVRLIHLGHGSDIKAARENWPEFLPDVFKVLEAYARSRHREYDIIHSHYWLSGVVGAMAQARWRRPHVTMFHTLGAVKNRTCAGEAESQLRIAHERWLAMSADRVVVAAPREMDNLIRFSHARRTHVSVVPCGVNLELFRPADRIASRRHLEIAPDSDVVLYVGRFAPLKGLDRLIRAAGQLRSRFPKLHLLIIGGDGPQAPSSLNLIALAAQLGLADAVRFVGRVEQQDLPPYYSAADLLAFPSDYESFGLVVLEALACGIPVVATPVGAVESIIQDGVNGILIGSADDGAVAEGIARILAQPPERRPGNRQIRATAEAYGWQRVAAAVGDIYESLLEAHDPAQNPPVMAPCAGGLPN
ncbi:MAG: glycosyltransferase family 1 protein [Desulfobacteraceae bacterium]|nr:MAG: glycosyltransferase family 1 protein [Desulfobacteraceae bacterium]